MHRNFLIIYLLAVLCLLTTLTYGQTLSFKQLYDKVHALNNALHYTQSQALLLPVLTDARYTSDEKYQAALLLSYTYKRVYDYRSTLKFLDEAWRFGSQTANRGPYRAMIDGQKAFVYFDTHQYPQADTLMDRLSATGFRHLDLEVQSKLIMQQGYLLYLAKDYAPADSTYDRAIRVMRISSPCDLPMIYVKKMQLYAAINRMDMVRKTLAQSSQYADSCGILKYHLYAYDELHDIYKARNDAVGLAATVRTLDSLNDLYDKETKLAELHNQKADLLLAAKDRTLADERTSRLYATSIAVGLVLLLLVLGGWLITYRRKKQRMKGKLAQVKADLDRHLASTQPALTDSAPAVQTPVLYTDLLSERQVAVLQAMAEGLSNREIADRLFISENTVKYHVKNIYQLLDIKDRKKLLVSLKK